MSYPSTPTDCRQVFSTQQKEKMRYSLIERNSNLIREPIRLTNSVVEGNAGGKLKAIQGTQYQIIESGELAGLFKNQSATVLTLNERFTNWQGDGTTKKHHHWNTDFSFSNLTKTFQVQTGADQTAWFENLRPVEIRTDYISTDNYNGDFEFHDPWFVESDGTQPDDFLPFSSPYQPTGARNESSGGVFLDQPYDDPPNPFYSVRVPAETVIPFHNQDITWYFQNWVGTNVQFQTPNNPQTAVVFQQANAVAEARFKGHLVSKEPNPTGVNNSRKVVRAFDGSLHLVYEDDGRIWYTTSADDGQTWDKERNLSGIANENLSHTNPAIASSTTGLGHCFLHVVWSTQSDDPGFGNYSYISYKSFDGFIWKDTEEFKYENTLPHFSSWEEIRPAIYAEGQGDVTLAWRSKSLDDNIIRDYVVHSSNEVWTVPAIVPNATGHPALDKNEGGTHVVWTDGKSIYLEIEDQYNFTWNSIDLTEKFELPLMKNYANPAIACSGENDASITWEAYYSALRKNVVCHLELLELEGGLLSIFASDQSGVAYANAVVARDEVGSVRMALEETVNPTEIAEIFGNGSSWIFPPASHGEGRAPTLSDNDDLVLLYSTGNFAPYIITGPGVSMNKPTNEAYVYSRSLCYPYALNSNNGQSTIELDLSAFAQDSTTVNDTSGFLQTPKFIAENAAPLELNYRIGMTKLEESDSLDGTLAGVNVVLMDGITETPVRVLKQHSLLDYVTSAIDSSFYFNLIFDLSGLESRSLYLQLTPVLTGTVKSSRVQMYLAGSETGIPKPANVKAEQIKATPSTYTLHPVYPNPFNPTTTINFELPVATHVKIIVYSASGEKVRELVNAPMSAGSHHIQFDGSNLATGLYFCEMKAGNFQQVQKMLLVK